jgi:hypothetical protein
VSMAGKSFQCISCNRTIPIPGPANAASEDPDPLAMDQPNTSLGDPFDGNFPDLGLPTVAHVPYHAPITNPQPKKVEASESYDYRSAPNKNLKSNFNFNQDTWILVTAILCILHGLGRAGNLPVSILPMVASGAVFSMGGIDSKRKVSDGWSNRRVDVLCTDSDSHNLVPCRVGRFHPYSSIDKELHHVRCVVFLRNHW